MHKRKAFTYALFAAIAVALVFSSYFVRNVLKAAGHSDLADFIADILIQVGLVVGAIALVDWLWGLVGGEPLAAQIESLKKLYELQKDAEHTGITRVYAQAHEISISHWTELIKESKSRIDIASETAFEIAEQSCLSDAIVERIKHGVKVRILFNSPGS